MKRSAAVFLSAAVPLLLLPLWIFRESLAALTTASWYPDCTFHRLTGWLCPACGNTRALLALLNGHVLQSLGYNPMIFILAAVLLALYAEVVCRALGKPMRFLPRSNLLLYITIGLVLGYAVLRNFFPGITLCG